MCRHKLSQWTVSHGAAPSDKLSYSMLSLRMAAQLHVCLSAGGGGRCGGGGRRRMSFSLSRAVHSGQCIVILVTIWCVGDEFTSLCGGQASADSCMCRNWQLHSKATLVIVQHTQRHCSRRVLNVSRVDKNAPCSNTSC